MVQIRELGATDAQAFQALRLAALQAQPSAFASSYEEEAVTPIDVVAERLAPRPDRCVFGASLETELVGIAGLRRENLHKLRHKAFIWGVYVDPRVRRRSIGRQLLQQVLSRAAAMDGLRQVILGVNAANVEALALYQAAGFASFGVERGFMLIDGQLHDEIHMVRPI